MIVSKLSASIESLQTLEWLERAVLGKAKGDPSILTDEGFVRAVLAEAKKLIGAVGTAINTKEFKRRLRRSTNVDWKGATTAQRNKALTQVSNLLKGLPTIFLPAITAVLDLQGKTVVGATHKVLGKKFKKLSVIPTFVAENKTAIEAISRTTSIFFKPEYEAQALRFRSRAQSVISRGLKRGFGRVQIGEDLRNEFIEVALHRNYWETVAAVHVNRGRSFSAAVSYAKGGVTSYEVLAVLDERTTDVCRMMNGTILSVDSALDSFEAFEDATDLDEVKAVSNPFMRRQGNSIVLPSGTRVATVGARGGFSKVLSSTKMNTNGINMPPYHYRCRTTVVPVFEESK